MDASLQDASSGGAQRASGADAGAQAQLSAGGSGAADGARAPPERPKPQEPARDAASAEGAADAAQRQQGADTLQAASVPQPVNPFRSLGDAREQLRRDLLVGNHDDAAAEEDAGGDEAAEAPAEGAEAQFVRSEKKESGAAQVLADATREQAEAHAAAAAAAAAMATDDNTAGAGERLEEGAEDAAEQGAEDMDAQDSSAEGGAGEQQAPGARGALQLAAEAGGAAGAAGGAVDSDRGPGSGSDDEMDADTPADAHAAHHDGANATHIAPPGAANANAPVDALVAGLDALLVSTGAEPPRDPVDASRAAPAATCAPAVAARGARLFARCAALTGGLTWELVEQLRLVLESTTASRLSGDYKSGKRLNMKKVIAYVASSFRQDKIWQRRTRPDARRYQVVLAVDETRSMRVRLLLDEHVAYCRLCTIRCHSQRMLIKS
jgi:midasin